MKINILVVIPVANLDESVVEKDIDYLRRFVSSDVTLRGFSLDKGPTALESELDTVMAAPNIIEKVLKTDLEDIHGIYITCFDDPGVDALKECLDIPVVGACKSSLIHAMNYSDNIGILAPVKESIKSSQSKVNMYGMSDRVKNISSVDTSVLALSDSDSLCNNALDIIEKQINADNIGVVIFGCTQMRFIYDDLTKALQERELDIKIIEPFSVAVSNLEHIIRTR